MNKASFIFGFVIFFVLLVFIQKGIPQQECKNIWEDIGCQIDSPGNTIGSDFNGDGIHDFIVGAHQNNDGGSNNEGAAYVFFGASNLSGTIDLGAAQSADMTVLGKATTDALGRGVSSAGDVNGDGIDDMIVGAPYNNDGGSNNEGAAYIFFGATNLSGTKTLGGVDSADVTILGKGAGDFLGFSVSAAGDVNGDGFDDLFIGAFSNEEGAAGGGAAYLFFGASDLSGTKALGKGQSADVTILAKASSDQLGANVSGAGDVNGDGFDDIITGAHLHNNGATADTGVAYIFFGASNLSGTKDLGGVESADVTILGKAASDQLGRDTSGAGDVNGDGFDDLIIGARLNNDGGSDDEGAAYIFFGASNLSGTKDLGRTASADVTFLGKAIDDVLGRGVSGAGDVNDDGFDDLIIGAYLNNDGGSDDEGAAYIFFGASDLSGTKALGKGQSADVSILGTGANDFLGRSVSGTGDVNADGIPDIIVGADYNDDAVGRGDHGTAYIFFGATDLSGTKDAGSSDEDVKVLGKGGSDRLGLSVGGGRSNPGP